MPVCTVRRCSHESSHFSQIRDGRLYNSRDERMPGLSQNDCLPDKDADGDGGPEAVVHATRYESKEVSVAHERTERI